MMMRSAVVRRAVSAAAAQSPAPGERCAGVRSCGERLTRGIRSMSCARPSNSGILRSSSKPARASCQTSTYSASISSANAHTSIGANDSGCFRPLLASPESIRCFSTDIPEPTIDVQSIQDAIVERAPEMSEQLATKGYYTCTDFLPKSVIELLRSQ